MPLHEGPGLVQLLGGLEGERLDALQGSLGDAGQGARGRHLQDAGDTQVGHGVQAQVPPDGVGDLAHDAGQHLAAVVDHVAVPVGDHPGARVVGGHRTGQSCEVAHRRRHVRGVEGARDAERHQTCLRRRCLRQRGELLRGARGHELARTVVVGRGQAEGLQRRQHLLAVATEDCGHPGRAHRGRVRHRPAPLPHQHHGLLCGHDAGARRRGQLPDAVARDRADAPERVGRVGEELQGGDQAGGHEQRLSDLGVPDRLGVRERPVTHEVKSRHGGEPLEAGAEDRVLDPGSEESGGLGPLAGGDDDEHANHCARSRRASLLGLARKISGQFCGVPTKSRPSTP